jgi:protein phosphatase
VCQLGEKISPSTGIATTLTMGSFRGDEVQIAHVGDSRCYCWHREGFLCLTTDHSDGRMLSRCLGLAEPVAVDLIDRQLETGERYLFCSDGLTNFVRESQIAGALRQGGDPSAIAGLLVRSALEGGGGDNVTVVVVLVG